MAGVTANTRTKSCIDKTKAQMLNLLNIFITPSLGLLYQKNLLKSKGIFGRKMNRSLDNHLLKKFAYAFQFTFIKEGFLGLLQP